MKEEFKGIFIGGGLLATPFILLTVGIGWGSLAWVVFYIMATYIIYQHEQLNN